MDRVYLPFYRTLMTRGREEAYGEAVDAVLAWPFSRVVGPATARSSRRGRTPRYERTC